MAGLKAVQDVFAAWAASVVSRLSGMGELQSRLALWGVAGGLSILALKFRLVSWWVEACGRFVGVVVQAVSVWGQARSSAEAAAAWADSFWSYANTFVPLNEIVGLMVSYFSVYVAVAVVSAQIRVVKRVFSFAASMMRR